MPVVQRLAFMLMLIQSTFDIDSGCIIFRIDVPVLAAWAVTVCLAVYVHIVLLCLYGCAR